MTLFQGPSCWDDVILQSCIHGVCQSDGCHGTEAVSRWSYTHSSDLVVGLLDGLTQNIHVHMHVCRSSTWSVRPILPQMTTTLWPSTSLWPTAETSLVLPALTSRNTHKLHWRTHTFALTGASSVHHVCTTWCLSLSGVWSWSSSVRSVMRSVSTVSVVTVKPG